MPVPDDGAVRGLVARISDYVKHHEILLIAVFVIALVWGVSGKVQDIIAAHDSKNLILAQQQLQAQVEKNAELAKAAEQQAAQYAAQQAETARLNASLELANSALVSALAKQQATDKTLPDPLLAARIAALANIPPGVITGGTQGGFNVPRPAAEQIAVTLEEVPALQGQLKNVQQEKVNTDVLLDSANKSIGTLNARVDGLNLQIVRADDVCKDQIKVVKDDAAKSKRKWFVIGFITGFFARQALQHP